MSQLVPSIPYALPVRPEQLETVRRFSASIEERRLEELDEFLWPDALLVSPTYQKDDPDGLVEWRGLEEIREQYRKAAASRPDGFRYDGAIQGARQDEDTVLVRSTSNFPTPEGPVVVFCLSVYRFRGARIAHMRFGTIRAVTAPSSGVASFAAYLGGEPPFTRARSRRERSCSHGAPLASGRTSSG